MKEWITFSGCVGKTIQKISFDQERVRAALPTVRCEGCTCGRAWPACERAEP